MEKTIAEIEYGGDVLPDWIGSGFCHIKFWGDNADKYQEDCNKIELELYEIYNPKCEELEERIKKLNKKIEKNRRWYHIFYTTKDEKELNILTKNLEEMEDKCWKDADTLYIEYTIYLENQGFVKIQHSYVGGDFGYDVELWEKLNKKQLVG